MKQHYEDAHGSIDVCRESSLKRLQRAARQKRLGWLVRIVRLEEVRSTFSLPDVAAMRSGQSGQSALQVLSNLSCWSAPWPLEDGLEGASPATGRPEREVARQHVPVFPICQIASASASASPSP